MKQKTKKIISIAAIVLIVILLLSATYAYFAAQTDAGSSTDINVTTATVDNLTFETGDVISIEATQTNFASGMTSLSDDTYASATLVANNDTNSVSANYYVYLSISTNDFVYTTSDSTAELILTISLDGMEQTDLASTLGLSYVTVTDGTGSTISGYDITELSGLITIADNYLIESTGTEVDDWEITVTFVNLDSNQSDNAGASFSASLIIQSDELITLADYIISLYSEDGVNSLYYFDGEGNYTNSDLEAIDYSYRYSGGDYVLTDFAIDEGYTQIATSRYSSGIVNFYCNGSKSYVDWTCQSSYTFYYTLAYDEDAIKYETYQEALDQAVVDGYLTSGNIKNYICFGSDDDECSNDNLYRIIGVFENTSEKYETKLIKADYAGINLLGEDGDYDKNELYYTMSGTLNSTSSYYSYFWGESNYSASEAATGYENDWSYSYLNTINLNTNYLNNISEKCSNMITEHTWIVGGNTYDNIFSVDAKNLYKNELVNYITSEVTSTYKTKIGLMYISDYAYAASPIYWTMGIEEYDGYSNGLPAYQNDWLKQGISEWAITRISIYSASYVSFSGAAYDSQIGAGMAIVRPTFYLNSSVTVISGDGSYESPYRISMS